MAENKNTKKKPAVKKADALDPELRARVDEALAAAPPLRFKRPKEKAAMLSILESVDGASGDNPAGYSAVVATVDDALESVCGQPYVDWVEGLDDDIQMITMVALLDRALGKAGF
jgi:hypothetical protein